MPRRVIYIKNPKSGSHFRTIDGNSGSGGRRSGNNSGGIPQSVLDWTKNAHRKGFKKDGKGIPYRGGVVTLTGGARYNRPDSNWFIFQPQQGYSNFGTLPGNRVGPYEQEWTPEFQPASTLLGRLYDLARGIHPETGGVVPPLGTTGTLKFGAGTMWMSLTQEQADTGRIPGNPAFHGWSAGASGYGTSKGPANLWPTLSGEWWNYHPDRFEPRPDWLQWYEDIQ
jgi:hypothetical protein